MSDSPPPSWGPAPYDDRDLDAVLSCDSASVPEALRAVDAAMRALRAAPVRAELEGEEAARAAFRLHAPVAQPALAAPAASGALLTRIPPAMTTGEAARPHSHRQPRRVRRPVRWQAVALVGGGAAAAAVACAVFVGAFSGPGGHHGVPREAASATIVRPSSTDSGPRTLTGGASKETPKPTPTGTGGQQGAAAQDQGPTALCRALADSMASPSAHDDGTASGDYQKLTQLAHGEGPFSYCSKVLGHAPWTPPVPYSGSHQGGQGFPVYRFPGRWMPDGHDGFGSGHSRSGPGFDGRR